MSDQPPLSHAVDEPPPHALSALLGLQHVVLVVGGITLTPMIVLRAAGGGAEAWMAWTAFAALLVSGLTTVIQARPIGRVGSGYLLFMGTSGAFIAICIAAVQAGGLALMGSLVVVSSFIEFLFGARLAWLRRLVTPTVGGTVIMLIAVTVFPICFGMLGASPLAGAPGQRAALVTALVTLVVILGACFFGGDRLRVWGPILGVLAGCLAAHRLGMMEFGPVTEAPWLGLPESGWPGLDLGFGPAFWSLLPGFVIVTLVATVETYGDGVAIQKVSHRGPRPTDFRAVQGAVHADGLGNLLSGLAGTVPNTTYSTTASVVELTGVAARRVGVYGGLLLMALAFSPKLSALIQVIPAPVAAVYLMVLLIAMFVHGLRLVTEHGLSYEDGLVVGLAFWAGTGFQGQALFPELMPRWARQLFDNGMTAGGVVSLVLTALLALRRRAPVHIELAPEAASVQTLQGFLSRLAASRGWPGETLMKLELVAEEALVFLLANARDTGRRLHVWARPGETRIELEFVAAGPGQRNLEGLVGQLRAAGAEPVPEDIGPGLLRHLAEDIRHQQFHEAECLSLAVTVGPEGARR